MPRLVSISFNTSPRLPGMHGAPLTVDLPLKGALTDWKIAVRATTILLRSPPGWFPGQPAVARRNGEPLGSDVTTYEVPRAWAALAWAWAEGETPHEVVSWDEDGVVDPDDNTKFPKAVDAEVTAPMKKPGWPKGKPRKAAEEPTP